MAFPFAQAAFAFGELAPTLFGRFDLARWHVACGTLRNMTVRYQGGASSRAGFLFCNFSRQTGRVYPPRMVPFVFSNQQGLALEFGHHYMRVFRQGAPVTEQAVALTNITQSAAATATHVGVFGATSAIPINTGVTNKYAPGDFITLAGGIFSSPAMLRVVTTTLLAIQLVDTGSGVYAPGNTITLAGGVSSPAPVVTVTLTKVVAATPATAGTLGTPGPAVVTGTTGTGSFFTANVTIDGGGGIDPAQPIEIVSTGSYSVNPTTPANEPVTGGGLAGATLNVQMGVQTFTLTNPGIFTENPAAGVFTQASTSGSGVGAIFASGAVGIASVVVQEAGNYTAFPPNPVAQESTTGTGRGATFTMSQGAVSPFNPGDWVQLQNISGMSQLNGRVVIVGGATPTTFTLLDVYGVPINTLTYGAFTGGQAARVFTLATPYQESDLPYLKYAQSADVMSLCLVNPITRQEYYPQELVRLANNRWEMAPLSTAATIDPPQSGFATGAGAGTTNYQYVVTAVSAADGSESIASQIFSITNSVNIATTPGSNTVNWQTVNGSSHYKIYKATPGYGTPIPVGAPFGFVARAFGNTFIDSNYVPDLANVPPVHKNPFARGRILGVLPTASGAGYTTITATIVTTTGSGAVLRPTLVGSGFAGVVVEQEGEGYLPTDTIVLSGDGTGATAVLDVGPQTGTYPSVVNYFQQRRVYGATLNQPDTYFMSKPGAYTNFDVRTPPLDDDAITGNPWSVQVNGIQFFDNLPGGLLAYTGLEVYQLTGNGGSSFNPQPITPASQQVQPQAYNGSSSTVGPVKIGPESIFVQAKGSIIRNLGYSYSSNIYGGEDLTLSSSHLFTGQELRDRAWVEEPYKVYWATRDDGVLLSMTYVKDQELKGWGRHDTQGQFKTMCSIPEPPVDALYVAVSRLIGGRPSYTIERMDNRIWPNVEDVWAVDCGVALPQQTPNAILTGDSATGLGAISGYTDLVGGTNWSAGTYAVIEDEDGPGSGATASVTVVGGVIVDVPILTPGANYAYPRISFFDPAGSDGGRDASARLTLDNTATFRTSTPVTAFAPGYVIRSGGGIARVTAIVSLQEFTVQIISPITALFPNTGNIPAPQGPGDWTVTAPVTSVAAPHLAGALVRGLYDGKLLPPTVVPATGVIALPAPATQVIVGLGYTAQIQSIMADPPGQTIQGQRKAIPGATVRIDASRDVKGGVNQIDGSRMSPPQIEATWTDLQDIPNAGKAPYNSDVTPLGSADVHTALFGGFATPGQVCLQQDNPLPLNVLAFVPDILPGDLPEIGDGGKSAGRAKSGMVPQ